jgi:uncharacterized protein YggU (UPF0235/DUF167 family)
VLFRENLPIKILEGKILLNIKVSAKSSQSRFGNILNNSLKIYVTEAAESGRANKAVINLISETL